MTSGPDETSKHVEIIRTASVTINRERPPADERKLDAMVCQGSEQIREVGVELHRSIRKISPGISLRANVGRARPLASNCVTHNCHMASSRSIVKLAPRSRGFGVPTRTTEPS